MNTTRMTIFAAMFATGLAGAAHAVDGMTAPREDMAKSDGMMKAGKDGMAKPKPKAMAMKHDGMKHDAMKGDAMKGDAMKADGMAH
jgi:pentapeptide MXKDX repeat protein